MYNDHLLDPTDWLCVKVYYAANVFGCIAFKTTAVTKAALYWSSVILILAYLVKHIQVWPSKGEHFRLYMAGFD